MLPVNHGGSKSGEPRLVNGKQRLNEFLCHSVIFQFNGYKMWSSVSEPVHPGIRHEIVPNLFSDSALLFPLRFKHPTSYARANLAFSFG